MGKISMKGVCDMHVHTNPDLRLRAYDDFELADAAVRVGASAIVIKTHLGFTVNRAYLTNQYVKKVYGENTGFTMYGGVVMNKVIGGINPEAVEKGLKLGAKEIWLPTQSAKRHLEKMGQDPADGIELVRDGKVVPELIEAARDAGVKKIVITHPEWWVVDMSMEDQIRLVKDYDVILERCYAQNMGGGAYKSNLPDNLEIIKAVGYEHVMVDTDGGQTENPNWELALEEYMQYLADHGIPEEHIYHMTKTIPYKLLGIE